MRAPPCVGCMCGSRTFSLVSGLPSRLSAVGRPPLFEPFIGTTPESDSCPALLWVVRLSPSPTGLPPYCAADADQVSRFSCMMFPDVRGVSDCAGSPVVFAVCYRIDTLNLFFHSSIPGLPVPLSTLRLQPLD